MPLFTYACTDCGMDYEVARDTARADDEAFCPVCGTAIARRKDGAWQRARGFASLFLHAHGTGPGQHKHW